MRRTDERRNTRAKWAHRLVALALVAALCAAMFTLWFAGVRAQGGAMAPLVAEGDVLLVDRLAYFVWGAKRGELVAAVAENGAIVLRRVIALGGERVDILGGKVYIGGCLLEEPYASGVAGDCSELSVPKDSVFLLPDARDGRPGEIERIPELLGRVLARVAPFSKATFFA